jgi:hypothetical protein
MSAPVTTVRDNIQFDAGHRYARICDSEHHNHDRRIADHIRNGGRPGGKRARFLSRGILFGINARTIPSFGAGIDKPLR